MVNIKEKKDCCGCSACYSICPQRAITMNEDDEGFLYPIIDKRLCINCRLCERVCAFDDEYFVRLNIVTYKSTKAAFSKNSKVHKDSRSGGVFYELANSVLNNGGMVFGVGFDDAFDAKTIQIKNPSELSKLQGSKYVQSNKGNSFLKVKECLNAGDIVLFSGTACEVAGLKSFLLLSNTNQDNLLTCDVVCHGTPSPLLWRKQIEHIKRKRKAQLDRVEFRDKSFGWYPHIEAYHFIDGKTIYENRYTSIFYESISLRPSCGVCHYCNTRRPSDITLADGWGAATEHPELDTRQGVNSVIVNTDKGQKYFDKISKALVLYDIPLQTESVQPNLYHPTIESAQRDKFWKVYTSRGFEYSFNQFYSIIDRAKLPYNLLRRKLTLGHQNK